MNSLVKSFFILSLLILPNLLLGQAPNITVNLVLFNNQANIFYIGDLDPTGLGNAPNYYTLEIGNLGSTDERVQLGFEIISDNKSFVDATSNAFTLPSNHTYAFTNNQLNLGAAIIPETGEEIEITDYNLNFDEINNLQNVVTSTGKLPAGIYRFVFTVVFE